MFKLMLIKAVKLFLVPTILALIWFLTSTKTSIFFPPPDIVFAALLDDVNTNNSLMLDIVISIKRLIIGSLIGISLGLVVGTILGANNQVYSYFSSTVNGLKCVPTTALIPFVIMIFGMTEIATVTVIAISSSIPSLITAINAVHSVKQKYSVLAQNLELTNIERMTKIFIPGAMPEIFTGIDLSINLSFKMMVLAEMLGANAGLGFRLMENSHYLNFDKVLYVIIILCVLSILITGLIGVIRKWSLKWV